MNHRSAVAALAIVLVAGGAVAGCSSDDSSSADSTSTTTTTEATKNFQVATPEGQVSLSLDGELPPGWPEDFPLPDGAEPAGSGSLGGSESTVRVGVFEVSGSGREVLDFYAGDDALETGEPSFVGSGEDLVGSIDLVSPYAGSVTVLSRDGVGYLVVGLTGSGATETTAGN